MDYINNITETIGNTPLLKLNKIGKGGGGNVFVKLENLNPSGSYKDRMALAMVEAAERGETWNGRRLSPGGTVLEASAGNTAPALAMVCASKGYKARFYLYRYMFENNTNSRMMITRSYGPEVAISSTPDTYLTAEELAKIPPSDLMDVIAAKVDCDRLERENPGFVWVDQIYNMANMEGQKQIGYEIYNQLGGQVDAVGCSAATAGSLFGIYNGLKEKGVRPGVVFGVVPHGSECYLHLDKDECKYGEYTISQEYKRITEAFKLEKWMKETSIVEHMLEEKIPDVAFRVTHEDARKMAYRLCEEEGIYCGMSSGANGLIALEIARRLGKGKNVVTTIVDRRDRHMSEDGHEKYAI